jgi:hypothetical protein
LADSVAYLVAGPHELIVGANAPYAKWLEGFIENRIAPRPFIRPSVESNAREIVQSIERNVLKQLGKT